MKITINDRRRLKRQLDLAVAIDPELQNVLALVGRPEPRKRTADFATLLDIIVAQQVSIHAAAAISDKVRRMCRGQVTWRKILNRSEEQLRECGLSWRKVEYARSLAAMIRDKTLNLEVLAEMETEQGIAELIKVRGFGRWSAEIYMMFALGRLDVYPAGDLALRIAIQRYLGLQNEPSEKETVVIAQRWSPHRSAVALLMWKYYGATTLA